MDTLKVAEALEQLSVLNSPPRGTDLTGWTANLRTTLEQVRVAGKAGGGRKTWSRDAEMLVTLSAFVVAQHGALTFVPDKSSPKNQEKGMKVRDAHGLVDIWTILESAWFLIVDLGTALDKSDTFTPHQRALAGAALARSQEVTGRLVERLLRSERSRELTGLVDLFSDLESGLRVAELGRAVRSEVDLLAGRL